MKKILLVSLMFLMFAGVVSASSINGEYNGNPIVKLKSNATLLDTGDVPAMIYDGKTMVPIAALRNLGADVTWDADTYSVDVKLPETSIKDQMRKLNGNVKFTLQNGKLYAYSDFIQKTNYAEDQFAMWEVLQNLSSLSADVVGMNYLSNDSKIIGTLEIDNKYLLDYKNGVLSDLNPYYRITGDLGGSPSSAAFSTKELAKLKDRVGYVTSFDLSQKPIGQGSGFMIDGGVFITNYHVAGNTGGLEIILDGVKYSTFGEYLIQNQNSDVFGVVIGTQKDSSGALTGGFPTKTLPYTTELPEVGDKVYAIGSPKGLENTFSEGIVSAVRNINGIIMIQHTANTDHGSSGGVLLNESGQAIGITSSGIAGTPLDFAIPMLYVQQELDKLPK